MFQCSMGSSDAPDFTTNIVLYTLLDETPCHTMKWNSIWFKDFHLLLRYITCFITQLPLYGETCHVSQN